ncbi:MAG: ATP-dependent helicase/nuclease subunit A, partial [Granulosicoccus sp.]
MGSPIDADVRARALDPQTSFIVQAPAGSGKTELLTRRVLTLLATVDEPEEILAITFTRKAASEMRQRVVATLVSVANGSQPVNDYEAEGHSLALTVLERDKERDWQLIKNPQRLNLRTIDALATQLAHRLPVTSALGAPTGVVEDAGSLYRDVASRFIDENIELMQRVLLQLGNRLEQAQSLLANLLANRDQWKRHVYAVDDHDALRDVLEG